MEELANCDRRDNRNVPAVGPTAGVCFTTESEHHFAVDRAGFPYYNNTKNFVTIEEIVFSLSLQNLDGSPPLAASVASLPDAPDGGGLSVSLQ
jgi:hypothetical protein